MEAAEAASAFEVNMPAEMRSGRSDFIATGMQHAYCGDPAAASAAEGDATYAVLVEMLSELVRSPVDE